MKKIIARAVGILCLMAVLLGCEPKPQKTLPIKIS